MGITGMRSDTPTEQRKTRRIYSVPGERCQCKSSPTSVQPSPKSVQLNITPLWEMGGNSEERQFPSGRCLLEVLGAA